MTDKYRLPAMSVVVFAALLILLWHWWQAKPVSLVNLDNAQIACLSYAPYRRPGHTPLRGNRVILPAHIQEDLNLLRPHTNCIRTYAATQGLEAILPVAKALGMQVLQGVWIGRDHEDNLARVANALKLVNLYPDTVRALIVGNEVSLRGEQPRQRIAQYLRMARAGTALPVTYADVWEFWERNPTLSNEVDFVTVHILPYWEDHPVAVDNAVRHVAKIYRHVTGLFPDKRVLIGETGWPSVGRMRGPARPGRTEQARFVREWLAHVQRQGPGDYNLIEAFDQPWKRDLEGAMGAGWGLLNSAGHVKFPARGPVADNPGGLGSGLLWGSVAAVIIMLINVLLSRSLAAPIRQSPLLLLGAAVGFTAGTLLAIQWTYLLQWSRNSVEWAAGILIVLAGWLLLVLLPWLPPRQRMTGFVAAMRADAWVTRLWCAARLVIVFGAAFMLVLHVFDPRYRGYPTALYLTGAIALVAAWAAGYGASRDALEEKCLAAGCLLLIPVALWPELPANTQSLAFVAAVAVVALAMLVPATFRSTTSTPSNNPTAPGSAE